MTGTLHEELCTFMITSRSILVRMRMFQTNVVQKIKTHFMFNNFFFENCDFYEIMWKYTVQPDRPKTTYCFSKATVVGRMRFNVTCVCVCVCMCVCVYVCVCVCVCVCIYIYIYIHTYILPVL